MKKQIPAGGRRHWIIFLWDLDPAAAEECTNFPSLVANVPLQLLRDIINGEYYHRYEKRLEQQKDCSNVMFGLQKKIWNRNDN